MRPARLIAVVGTRTDVGKTWASAELLSRWKARGLTVAARKPVQSFDPSSELTDADLLAAAATSEGPYGVCAPHRWYARALAPPMASDVMTRPRIVLDDLVCELKWPDVIDIGLVETAGGVCSPLAHDGDSAAYVRRIDPDEILLVADAGLGTINAIKLSMQCLERRRTRVFLNRFDANDPLHQLNMEWLSRHESLRVSTAVDDLV